MSLDLSKKPSTAVFWLLRSLRVVVILGNKLILFFSLNYWGIIYNVFLVSGVQHSAFLFFFLILGLSSRGDKKLQVRK